MPLSLILFPEGTDLSRENIAKSDAFAAQNKLPRYTYVLHPKGVWGLGFTVYGLRFRFNNPSCIATHTCYTPKVFRVCFP
jgi:hypothetical protein